MSPSSSPVFFPLARRLFNSPAAFQPIHSYERFVSYRVLLELKNVRRDPRGDAFDLYTILNERRIYYIIGTRVNELVDFFKHRCWSNRYKFQKSNARYTLTNKLKNFSSLDLILRVNEKINKLISHHTFFHSFDWIWPLLKLQYRLFIILNYNLKLNLI